MAKSPAEMEAAMVLNLAEKTGKALPAWLKICKASKLEKHGQIVKMLKSEHGVTHGFANLIAHNSLREGLAPPADADLVETQYGGAKAGLRPIYETLIKAIRRFGSDVVVAPKKAHVSLRRGKQFCIIQPSTKDRVDVGINLKGTDATDRLEKSGSFNAMVSHRVRVAEKGQVDKELIGWLKQAYAAS
jgi:hypothetical protein